MRKQWNRLIAKRGSKKLSTIVLLLMLLQLAAKAQESVVVSGARGSGSASSTKRIKKIIRLIDADSKTPLAGLKFSVARNNTVINGSRSDEHGYASLVFNMNNYYAKLEINMNDNKYKRPEWKEDRNEIAYKPLDSMIRFASKADVVDTVVVFLRKISQPRK